MVSINENMMVEKSRFLLGMKAPSYELGELKILDTYLARINARDPESKLVKFTKAEYEQLMGLKQIKPQLLKKNTQALLGKVVTLSYEDDEYEQYTLFTHARCRKDPETYEWIVELGCNEKLEPLFFNIEEAGYLRYRLKNILPLTSKYSVLLYLYFKDNIFRHTFEISLRELRSKLGVEDNKTYESFKYFKRDIIDKCVEEINKYTDIDISYERKIRGRLTVGLTFTVVGKKPVNLIEMDNMKQIGMFDDGGLPDILPHKYENQHFEFLAAACNYEFDQTQMEILLSLEAVRCLSDIGLPLEENQFKKHDYLSRKYKELNYRCARTDLKPIKDRFAYIKTIIEADC